MDQYIACPVNQRNDIILTEKNGYLNDKRINSFIDINQLMNQTFLVNEIGRKENYTYVVNLKIPPLRALNAQMQRFVKPNLIQHSIEILEAFQI